MFIQSATLSWLWYDLVLEKFKGIELILDYFSHPQVRNPNYELKYRACYIFINLWLLWVLMAATDWKSISYN